MQCLYKLSNVSGYDIEFDTQNGMTENLSVQTLISRVLANDIYIGSRALLLEIKIMNIFPNLYLILKNQNFRQQIFDQHNDQ